MDSEMIQKELDGLNQKMNEAVKNQTEEVKKALQAELDELKAKSEKNVNAEDFESLKERFEKSLEARKKESKDEPMTFKSEVAKNIDKIRAIVKGSKDTLTIKANTLTTSVASSTQAFFLPSIPELGVKERSLYNVLPKISVPFGSHNGQVKYVDWDEATIARAAAAVAEGAAFPESTASFKEYTEELKKIGDTLPVSEEFGEDQTVAAAELDRFILTNVDQEISDQLANGDGTLNTFRGILNRAPAYTVPQASITDPNIKDLVRKMRTGIVAGKGSKYNPDIVILNSNTLDQYALKKDANNNYLFDMERGTIAGLNVVEDNFIPDDVIVVGDRRYSAIYEMGGVMLSEDTTGTQFTQDLKTIKARKRLMMLIRESERSGFNKVVGVDAALTTLGTTPV